MIFTVFYYLIFLDIEFYNEEFYNEQSFYQYFGDIGGIRFNSGRQSRAAKIQPFFVYLHQCRLQQQAKLMSCLGLAFEDVRQKLVDIILGQQKM